MEKLLFEPCQRDGWYFRAADLFDVRMSNSHCLHVLYQRSARLQADGFALRDLRLENANLGLNIIEMKYLLASAAGDSVAAIDLSIVVIKFA